MPANLYAVCDIDSFFQILALVTDVTHDGSVCYVDSGIGTFVVSPHYDKQSLTPDMCQDGCAYLGAEFSLAGITQGNVCLCGKDDTGKERLRDKPSKWSRLIHMNFSRFDRDRIVHFLLFITMFGWKPMWRAQRIFLGLQC